MRLNLPFPLKSGIAQTILPVYLIKINLKHSYERHEIILRDRDIASIYHYKVNEESPLCVLFHGLTGSADSHYMKRTAKLALENDINIALVNMRGSACVTKKSKKPYHSGLSQDVEDIVNYISDNKLSDKIILTGFSLGGNLILKYLGTLNVNKAIKGAISVCPPCELDKCVDRMNQMKFPLFDYFFTKEIIRMAKENNYKIPKEFNQKNIDLKMLDEVFTAPYWGYESADDYYQKASSINDLKNIKIPTSILTALDDPIVDSRWAKKYQHKNLDITLTENGGHVGYLDKIYSKQPSFLEKFIVYKIKEL